MEIILFDSKVSLLEIFPCTKMFISEFFITIFLKGSVIIKQFRKIHAMIENTGLPMWYL